MAGRRPPSIKNVRKLLARPTAMFMILLSEEDKLKCWLEAARRCKHRLPSIHYDRLTEYREMCSDRGCIGPCLLLAFKEGLIVGTTRQQIKRDYHL